MDIKCYSCDKPLTRDEAYECSNECFECEINRLVWRLCRNVLKGRLTFSRLQTKIAAHLG